MLGTEVYALAFCSGVLAIPLIVLFLPRGFLREFSHVTSQTHLTEHILSEVCDNLLKGHETVGTRMGLML